MTLNSDVQTPTNTAFKPRIKGGRLIKWKGKAASLSPMQGGSVSALAIIVALSAGPALMTAPQAQAGSCTEGDAGVFTCSGPAAADEASLNLTGTPLVVTTIPGFGISAGAGSDNSLTGTGGLTFSDAYGSSISAVGTGLRASNSESGALSITTTGTVTGNNHHGIFARNGYAGTDLTITATDLTITAKDVSGNSSGINATNQGSGALTITTTGTVTGNNYYGILARNGYAGTDLTITAKDVSGNYDGINATNQGSGALTITTTGTVTGKSYDGIYARNGFYGTDLTITAKDVSGNYGGINATNQGSGALTITTTGTVEATGGEGGVGIKVTVYGGSYDSKGFGFSEAPIQPTGGDATVDIAGMVAGSRAAIEMRTYNKATLALRNGWGLNGAARGGYGTSDRLVLRGDANSSLALADIGDKIIGFENLVKEGASNWTLTGAQDYGQFTTVAVNEGTLTLEGAKVTLGQPSNPGYGDFMPKFSSSEEFGFTPFLIVEGPPPTPVEPLRFDIAPQGRLAAFGAAQIVGGGTVSNAGTITMVNGATTDSLTITGDYVGQNGTLALDTVLDDGANGGKSDKLLVTGNVSGTSRVAITPTGAGAETVADGILLVEVGGTTTADAFSIDGGGVLAGGFLYNVQQGGAAAGTANNWFLRSKKVQGGQGVASAPLVQLNFAGVSTFMKRLAGRTVGGVVSRNAGSGDGFILSSMSAEKPSSAQYWIKGSGTSGNGNLNRALAGSAYDTRSRTLSFGADFVGEGDWTFGISGRVGTLDSTVFDAIGSTRAKADAYGIGGSATWYGPSSTYVDLQAQFTRFSTDYSTPAAGVFKSGAISHSYSFGAEVGTVLKTSRTTTLTPYAQLSHTTLNSTAFSVAGTTYDLGNNSSTLARVGAQVDYRPQDNQRFYASAEFAHDFNPTNDIRINGLNLQYDNPQTIFTPRIGMEIGLAGAGKLTAEASYSGDLDKGRRSKGTTVTLGYVHSW